MMAGLAKASRALERGGLSCAVAFGTALCLLLAGWLLITLFFCLGGHS